VFSVGSASVSGSDATYNYTYTIPYKGKEEDEGLLFNNLFTLFNLILFNFNLFFIAKLFILFLLQGTCWTITEILFKIT
jgi:hypothetical protein